MARQDEGEQSLLLVTRPLRFSVPAGEVAPTERTRGLPGNGGLPSVLRLVPSLHLFRLRSPLELRGLLAAGARCADTSLRGECKRPVGECPRHVRGLAMQSGDGRVESVVGRRSATSNARHDHRAQRPRALRSRLSDGACASDDMWQREGVVVESTLVQHEAVVDKSFECPLSGLKTSVFGVNRVTELPDGSASIVSSFRRPPPVCSDGVVHRVRREVDLTGPSDSSVLDGNTGEYDRIAQRSEDASAGTENETRQVHLTSRIVGELYCDCVVWQRADVGYAPRRARIHSSGAILFGGRLVARGPNSPAVRLGAALPRSKLTLERRSEASHGAR